MNTESNPCPKCNSIYAYLDGQMLVCPECFHEWIPSTQTEEVKTQHKFLDMNGNLLNNGDSVMLGKDLKLGVTTLKTGTKVKNIKLLDEPVNDHDISCRVDGFGSIYLKCSVVKKI
jgi:protein PhnA